MLLYSSMQFLLKVNDIFVWKVQCNPHNNDDDNDDDYGSL